MRHTTRRILGGIPARRNFYCARMIADWLYWAIFTPLHAAAAILLRDSRLAARLLITADGALRRLYACAAMRGPR